MTTIEYFTPNAECPEIDGVKGVQSKAFDNEQNYTLTEIYIPAGTPMSNVRCSAWKVIVEKSGLDKAEEHARKCPYCEQIITWSTRVQLEFLPDYGIWVYYQGPG